MIEANNNLDFLLGPHDRRGLRMAYLESANEAIDFLDRHSDVKFSSAGRHPDYLELPGAAIAGRAFCPLEFDGRLLGRDFIRIRPPIQDFLILGGMMANKADIKALINRYRSVEGFARTARLVMRYAADRLRHKRGTRLVLGNALVARLYYSLVRAGVQMRFNCSLQSLSVDAGYVNRAVFGSDGGPLKLKASMGVVLATGGIGHHPELRATLAPEGITFHSLTFKRNRGDGIVAAQRIGADLERHAESFFWQPVSRVPAKSGGNRLFPHLYLDRAKPGLIAVNADGARFVNERSSYHHFVEAMLRRNNTAPAVLCYLICDANFIRTYGLGVIPPSTRNLHPYVKSGHIVIASTVTGLAERIGIDASGLVSSVDKNNRYAMPGDDPDFGKGRTELSRFNGESAHGPNLCLGPISSEPFCSLAIWPADAATSTGLMASADGVVLDAKGSMVRGLYACGNDMASVMHGIYPGPGTTNGPAMVFGYRIGLHAKAMLQKKQQQLPTWNQRRKRHLGFS